MANQTIFNCIHVVNYCSTNAALLLYTASNSKRKSIKQTISITRYINISKGAVNGVVGLPKRGLYALTYLKFKARYHDL